MKRCWIGVGFLLVLLMAGLAMSWIMEKIHSPIEENLNRAAASAMQGDWENSTRYFQRARDDWEAWDHFRSGFADHTPLEEISAGFLETEVYCATREAVDFAAHCRQLARKAAAVGDAHGLGWWNLF